VAFNVGSITAELELNGQQFIATLKNADEVLAAFGSSADDAGKKSEGFLASLLKFELIKFGFETAIDGIKSLLGFFGEAIEASDAFEASLLSLNVALELRGLGGLSEDLQDLAANMQNTTQFSQTATFEVSKFLALAGVKGKDLERFTKIVLDFSAATGVSTENAAKQFARTLSGGVGRSIAQYLPSVNELTKEQRKAGDAFKLAESQLGGFSEAIANSSAAIESRFRNAIQLTLKTLGDSLAPVQDVFFQLGTNVANVFTQGLKENQQGLLSFFASIGEFIVNALKKGVDFLIDFPVHIARVKLFFTELGGSILQVFADAKIAANEFFVFLAEKQVQIANSFAGKLLGFGDEEISQASAELDKATASLVTAQRASEDLKINIRDAANEGARNVTSAQEAADAIRSGADSSSTWAKTLFGVTGALDQAGASLKGMADGAAQVDQSLANISGGASQLAVRLAELRKQSGVDPNQIGLAAKKFGEVADKARDAADATDDISDSTDEATDSADQLASSFTRAAGAAKSAAQSFSTTAGGFGQFGADNFASMNQNRQGGSFGLGLDSSSKTAAYLQSVQGRTSKLSDIYGSRTLANLQIKKITELLRSQIQDETRAFSSGIIDELNRQGIFDTTQRNSYIAARFDEARRLGTLPRGATYNASTGTIGGYG